MSQVLLMKRICTTLAQLKYFYIVNTLKISINEYEITYLDESQIFGFRPRHQFKANEQCLM